MNDGRENILGKKGKIVSSQDKTIAKGSEGFDATMYGFTLLLGIKSVLTSSLQKDTEQGIDRSIYRSVRGLYRGCIDASDSESTLIFHSIFEILKICMSLHGSKL